MTWFKVDDTLAFHHKTVKAGNAAMGLWVRAGSWCAQQLTDGFVPTSIATTLGTAPQIAKLVQAGLWAEVEDGYRFHEWAADGRQPTRNEVREQRESGRDRKRKSPEKSDDHRGKSDEKSDDQREIFGRSQVNGGSHSDVTRPRARVDPTRPDPYTETPNGVSVGAPSIDASAQPSSQARPANTKHGSRLPDDWQVTAELIAWARDNAPHVDGRRETERFCDYWHSKAGQAARKVDWAKTWKNWMRTAQDRVNANGRAPTTPTAKANGWLDLVRTDNDQAAIGGSQ